MGEHTHGARAERSNRGEENDVDAVGLQGRCRGRARIHADRGDIIRLVAGEADMPLGNRADHTLLGKLLESVNRVDDVSPCENRSSSVVWIAAEVTIATLACASGVGVTQAGSSKVGVGKLSPSARIATSPDMTAS